MLKPSETLFKLIGSGFSRLEKSFVDKSQSSKKHVCLVVTLLILQVWTGTLRNLKRHKRFR